MQLRWHACTLWRGVTRDPPQFGGKTYRPATWANRQGKPSHDGVTARRMPLPWQATHSPHLRRFPHRVAPLSHGPHLLGSTSPTFPPRASRTPHRAGLSVKLTPGDGEGQAPQQLDGPRFNAQAHPPLDGGPAQPCHDLGLAGGRQESRGVPDHSGRLVLRRRTGDRPARVGWQRTRWDRCLPSGRRRRPIYEAPGGDLRRPRSTPCVPGCR